MPLGQALAVKSEHQRHVGVGRRRQSEQLLQRDLPGRRREQVIAAHDVADAIRRVVDDHRQLVGVQAVGAAHDDVADVCRELL